LTRFIIQIYEIQDPREAEALIALGVDHIGSVVTSEDNWRDPLLRETIALVQASGSRSSLIPLFKAPDAVLRTLDYYQPDIVHFCDALSSGSESVDVCARLSELQVRVKSRFPETAVMRSIPIGPPGCANHLTTLLYGRWFEPVTDYFLTDTQLVGGPEAAIGPQPVSGFVGITGQTCDWEMAASLVRQSRIPVILAGGVSPSNVIEAITRTRPSGIDSCTRTNAVDKQGRMIRFRKDLAKVKMLVEAVRRAELSTG
jgi:phosphoribosylanthranilate isomerase